MALLMEITINKSTLNIKRYSMLENDSTFRLKKRYFNEHKH